MFPNHMMLVVIVIAMHGGNMPLQIFQSALPDASNGERPPGAGIPRAEPVNAAIPEVEATRVTIVYKALPPRRGSGETE